MHMRIRYFLALHGVEVIPLAPYIPNLTPYDFFCFLQNLKGRRFEFS